MEKSAPGVISLKANQFEARIGNSVASVNLLDNTKIEVDGQKYSYDFVSSADGSLSLIVDNSVFEVNVIESTGVDADNSLHLDVNGVSYEIIVEDRRTMLRKGLQPNHTFPSKVQDVRAPMPGKVVRLEVKSGDMVKQGTGLLVLEAMKMENEINSTVSGRVGEILTATGRPVEKGEILLSIRPD